MPSKSTSNYKKLVRVRNLLKQADKLLQVWPKLHSSLLRAKLWTGHQMIPYVPELTLEGSNMRKYWSLLHCHMQKVQAILKWSGNQHVEIYQACCLDSSEISTAKLWSRFEEICKPQANILRTTYDLLKSFSQAG